MAWSFLDSTPQCLCVLLTRCSRSSAEDPKEKVLGIWGRNRQTDLCSLPESLRCFSLHYPKIRSAWAEALGSVEQAHCLRGTLEKTRDQNAHLCPTHVSPLHLGIISQWKGSVLTVPIFSPRKRQLEVLSEAYGKSKRGLWNPKCLSFMEVMPNSTHFHCMNSQRLFT